MKKIIISAGKTDKVLNIVSSQIDGMSYLLASQLLRQKDIRINGEKIKDNQKVMFGDEITVFVQEEKVDNFCPYEIIFEDENIVAVNKQKGIEVCDGENNLASMLLKDHSVIKPVHRIDRNTTGIVLFAKNKTIENELKNAFKNHNSIHKYYIAEIVGTPKQGEASLTAWLVKNEKESEVKIFKNKQPSSEKIETHYTVLKTSGGTSLVEIELKTGKTHQIRAHMAFIGHAVIGDGKYGKNEDNKKFKSKTQKLCANKITFDFANTSPLAYLNQKTFEITPEWLQKKEQN